MQIRHTQHDTFQVPTYMARIRIIVRAGLGVEELEPASVKLVGT